MNREIKFRGFWYDSNGKLHKITGDLTVAKNCHKRNYFPMGTKDGDCFISNSCGAPYAYKVIPKTIGQFTGSKDKNSLEIYESDLCKLKCEYEIPESQFTEGDTFSFTHYGEVKYMPSIGFYLSIYKSYDNYKSEWCETFPKIKNIVQYRTKKIGNIYENPELLKQ